MKLGNMVYIYLCIQLIVGWGSIEKASVYHVALSLVNSKYIFRVNELCRGIEYSS